MTQENGPIRVLLVDNSRSMLWGLGKLVQGESPKMNLVGKARTPSEALIHAIFHPSVIVLDIDLGGCNSLEIIPELLRRSGGNVLVYTGLRDKRLHDDAMLQGAVGVVQKGDPAESILQAIERAHRGAFWSRSLEDARPLAQDAALGDAQGRIGSLTSSERQMIVHLVAAWQSNKYTGGLASMKCVLQPDLKDLVSIYNKLGVRNRAELFLFAARYGLTSMADAID